MPLSTVCVSAVSSRPRIWSSYSNIRAKDVQGLTTMNSAEELSKYKENVDNYYSPTLQRRLLGYGYDLPDKTSKKDKKWSISGLFRRKKKIESDSSSEENSHKKGFLGRKKKKSEKKKKTKSIGTFDHVVFSQKSHLHRNGYNNYEEPGIFSDPSGSFNGYTSRTVHKSSPQEVKNNSLQNVSLDDVSNSRNSLEVGSVELQNKKSKKVLAKVRAEARRINLRNDSSSDEDSQRSTSSLRFRSDDNLGQVHRESSFSRRSRAARTERYLKRHSRDGEYTKDYLRLSKSDAENSTIQWKNSDDSNRSLSRSPLVPKSKTTNLYSSLSQSPSISGLSTIPPSHGSHNRIRVSNSTSNPSYKPPLSMNEYNYSTGQKCSENFDNHRSLSYDSNIHKPLSTEVDPEIMHVQFSSKKPNNRYRNLSLIDSRHVNSSYLRQQPPPPPPPRDPRRLVTAQYYENARSNTYLEGLGQMRSKSFNANLQISPLQQRKKFNQFNLISNCRSTSEDHLPKSNIHLIPRPSSATPDVLRNTQRYTEFQTNAENYNYLADKKPRSRKPIFIQSNNKHETCNDKSGTQTAIDFWKQKDREGTGFKDNVKNKLLKSPQMFTCQTHVQTKVFLPSVLQNDLNNDKLANSTDSLVIDTLGIKSSLLPVLPDEKSFLLNIHNFGKNKEEEQNEELKRKSSNLEEALDELEAIYNSLRLGDEDLLERAEQREKDAAAKKLKEQKKEVYPSWNMSRGALSDSSFSYEPFDSMDSPRRKRLVKKSQTIDRKADDMAYRKLNKERSATINDPQSALSKVSYLNASPVFGRDLPNEFEVPNKNSKEPDITLDDVVYRNVKFANSTLKVVEPQPPFGIPIGPITPAPNSDYLHAVPDNIQRPLFKPRKIPDIVKDDLAYRNLRKDQNKEPALRQLSPEDLKNNNTGESKLDLNHLKKKRAVRSLSANIGSLIHKDILAKGLEKYKNNNSDSSKILTDIADAMEIAKEVLKEKENRISSTRRAFLSDTDTNNGNELAESRMNFLNSLKTPSSCETLKALPISDHLEIKPFRGSPPDRKSSRSPKESTPIPVSSFEEKLSRRNDSRDSSLDDLLTALATEARETNERISNEINQYEENRKKSLLDTDENLNKYEITKKTLSDIDAVSEQAKLCEKLLEGVVDSSDLMASDKHIEEEVNQIDANSEVVESVANIIVTRDESKVVGKSEENRFESDHDYENLMSDEELNLEVDAGPEVKCTSPFEEHKAELIATFQELKKNVSLDIPVISKTPENDKNDESERNVKENDEAVTGEACVGVLDAASIKECAYVESIVRESNVPYLKNFVSNCDINVNRFTNELYPAEIESTKFQSERNTEDKLDSSAQLDSLESLKSPRLVLETSKLTKDDSNKQILENQSIICHDSHFNRPGTSGIMDLRRRGHSNSREPGHILDDFDDEKPTSAWYHDPATLAVACSYGFACVHELASLDFVAILGILFAVLSFIAALIF